MNRCQESEKLVFAATGILNAQEAASLLIHLEQCTICQKAREAILSNGKLFAFDESVYPEWKSED
jgi:hypothetical protein